MKLLFCGHCGDVVSPGLGDMKVRWCECKRSAVWWRDGSKGLLSVHDATFPTRNNSDGARQWVLGVNNNIMTYSGLTAYSGSPLEMIGNVTMRGNLQTRKHWVEAMLEACPDSYVFKRANSMIVRISPGVTNDIIWSELP